MDKEKEKINKPSVCYIVFLLVIATLILIWNFISQCTPMAAFQEWEPAEPGLRKTFFPLIKIYYFVTCFLFWLIPLVIYITVINLILKRKLKDGTIYLIKKGLRSLKNGLQVSSRMNRNPQY